MQSTPPDSRQQRSEIQMLRRRLMFLQPDIQDADLWNEISAWLYGTSDGSHRGSLESHVRGELASLTNDSDHKMFPHVGVDKPEDAFPDRCEGCEHYGKGCPILADHSGRKHLHRVYDTAQTDDDLASHLFELSNLYGCHVISGIVDERRTTTSQQKTKGHELYRRAMAEIKDEDFRAEISEDLFEDLDADPEEFGLTERDLRNGGSPTATSSSESTPFRTEPPEEVRDTVEAVSASVDVRNNEEEEAD